MLALEEQPALKAKQVQPVPPVLLALAELKVKLEPKALAVRSNYFRAISTKLIVSIPPTNLVEVGELLHDYFAPEFTESLGKLGFSAVSPVALNCPLKQIRPRSSVDRARAF